MCIPNLVKMDLEIAAKKSRRPPRFCLTFEIRRRWFPAHHRDRLVSNGFTFYHPTGERFGTRLLLSHLHDVFSHCHNPILMSTFCSCRYVTFYIVSITLLLYYNFVLLVYLQQKINPEILKSDSLPLSWNRSIVLGWNLEDHRKHHKNTEFHQPVYDPNTMARYNLQQRPMHLTKQKPAEMEIRQRRWR